MIVEAGLSQPRDGQGRRHIGQIQSALMLADLAIHQVQNLDIQLFFITEVVDHHTFSGLCLFSDLFHARTLQAERGKSGQGAGEDAFL